MVKIMPRRERRTYWQALCDLMPRRSSAAQSGYGEAKIPTWQDLQKIHPEVNILKRGSKLTFDGEALKPSKQPMSWQDFKRRRSKPRPV